MNWKNYLVAVLLCSMILALAFIQNSGSQTTFQYDPWADINDDGIIDIYDLVNLANKYGTTGDPIDKAAIMYDSGWLNITDKREQYITIIHNLNDTNVMVDIQGRLSIEGNIHQKYLGIICYKSGWIKTYENFDGHSLVQTDDYGFAMLGHIWREGQDDVCLIKTDDRGFEQWRKIFGGNNRDFGVSIIKTSDKGCLVAANTMSFGAGSWDIWLIKIDANGNVQWNKTFGGSDWDVIDGDKAIIQTSDGGYAFVGNTYSFMGPTHSTLWLVKTDMYGNMQWMRTYGPWWIGHGIVEIPGDGYMIAGANLTSGLLIKTDQYGNIQWYKTFQGHLFYSLIKTFDGGFAMVSRIGIEGRGWDIGLIKTNSTGDVEWSRLYGGNDTDVGYSLIQTPDNGYAILGWTESFGAGNLDFWLIVVDSRGNIVYTKTFGKGEGELGFSLIYTNDGGFAMTGSGLSLVKTSVEGEFGLALVGLTANTITLYRGTNDTDWNYVRVRIWRTKSKP